MYQCWTPASSSTSSLALFWRRPLLTDSFLFSIAAVSCLLYILCTWKFSSCCKLSFMCKEHGYSLYMRIQQLLQVVFYVQGACIFSIHENSAVAASCFLCSRSMYILCTWEFSSCCKLFFMFKEHVYSLYMRIQQLLQVVFYVQWAWIFSVRENSAAAPSCLLCTRSMDILCTRGTHLHTVQTANCT